MENLDEPKSGAAVCLSEHVKSLKPNMIPRAGSRDEVLNLCKALGPIGADFLVLFVDEQLNLVDAWRLARRKGAGIQGFPVARTIGLALKTKASGMIVAQERLADLVPRRPDLELTRRLKDMLGETEVELLDHFLISGNSLSACRSR